MIRTQIYLTPQEREGLSALGAATGKPQSEIIREAIDNLLAESSKVRRDAVLERAAGLWQDRGDLPDFSAVRRQWDRDRRP